jgi:hypothetical protein
VKVDGATVVWDLKKQRPVITLKDPNRCDAAAPSTLLAGLVFCVVSAGCLGECPAAPTRHALNRHTHLCADAHPARAHTLCGAPTARSQRRCSVLQWNPDVATQLVVASDDDRSPTLQMWDLRNSMSPVKEFVGHTKVRGCE